MPSRSPTPDKFRAFVAAAQRPRIIALIVVFSVALLLASGALNWTAVRAVDAALATLQQGHALQESVARLLASATDAQTAQRDFLNTGDSADLQRHDEAASGLDAVLRALQQTPVADAATAAGVAALSEAAARQREYLQLTVAQRREQGGEAARAIVTKGLDNHTMNMLRRQAATLSAVAAARTDNAQQVVMAQRDRAAAGAAATALLGLAATLGLGALAAISRSAVAQARAGRERLLAVLDATPAFIGVLAPDGTVQDANRALLEQAGLRRSDVVGHKFWDIPCWTHDPAVQQRQRDACKHASAGQTVRYDETMQLFAGGAEDGWATVEYTLKPVFSNGVLQMLVPSAINISARVHAEQALQASERLARERADELQTLMAAMPVAVWIAHDPRCEVVVGNPYSYQLIEVQGQPNVSASAPGDLPQRRPFQEFRDGRPVYSDELPLQRAARHGVDVDLEEITFVFTDGRVKHLLGSARPLHDADGRVRGAIASFVEITDFRRAQALLRERDLQISSLADNSPDILVRFDPALRHVFVSAAITRATGKQPADFIGRTNLELGMPEPWCGLWSGVTRRVFDSGEPGELEFDWDDQQGPRHYRSRLVPERDSAGRVAHVLAVITDVTETVSARRAAAAALAKAELRAEEAEAARRLLDGIMQHIPEAMVVASQSAQGFDVMLASRYAADLAGMPTQALYGPVDTGRPPWNIRHADGRSATAEEMPLARAIDHGEVIVTEEWQLQIGEGRWLPVLCSAGPIRDNEGHIVAGVIAWRDISELKRALAELLDADRRKDEFLATLVHELRNPLAPLRSGLYVLQQMPDAAVAAGVREMMARQLSHIVRLVDDLLDVSRITSGQVLLRLERQSLRVAAELAIETARPMMEAAGHTLVCHFPAEDVWVLADPTRLAQVIGNLLTNAAKYTPEDTAGGGHIVLTVFAHDGVAGISVSDNGVGIPPEMLQAVFGMFTHVSSTLPRAQGGLGIGLALVKKLVQLHGGSVESSSRGAGAGSVFTVTLPRLGGPSSAAREAPASATGPSAPGAEARPPPQGVGCRVLVVDDNVDAADSLAALLDAAGHSTCTAYGGHEALAAARDFDPDWVLLDIGLPDLDGYAVAQALHADPQTARARLVAVSGWGGDSDRQRSKAAGFAHHLTKPVEPAELEALLSDRLG